MELDFPSVAELVAAGENVAALQRELEEEKRRSEAAGASAAETAELRRKLAEAGGLRHQAEEKAQLDSASLAVLQRELGEVGRLREQLAGSSAAVAHLQQQLAEERTRRAGPSKEERNPEDEERERLRGEVTAAAENVIELRRELADRADRDGESATEIGRLRRELEGSAEVVKGLQLQLIKQRTTTAKGSAATPSKEAASSPSPRRPKAEEIRRLRAEVMTAGVCRCPLLPSLLMPG